MFIITNLIRIKFQNSINISFLHANKGPGTRGIFKVTKVSKIKWMEKIEIKSGFNFTFSTSTLRYQQQVEVKLPKSIVISFIESFTNPVVYLFKFES